MKLDEATDILQRHWSACSDASGLAFALQELGAIKISEPSNDRELQLVGEVLEEVAERLESYSTNRLYHKALLRGAKLVRQIKHEREVRAISTLRQGGKPALRRDIRTPRRADKKPL
jgi:hypothetical protein